MTQRVAVYGTLKSGFGNHRLLENKTTEFLGKGITSNKFTMYRRGIPFVYSKKETSNIHVEVYEVDEDTLENLDALEGHPEWYNRRSTPIVMENGEILDCDLYFYDHDNVKENTNLVEDGNYV